MNKPKGMVVHPAPGNPDGTLVNALLWHCKGSLSGIGGEIRPGIVHRIDKDTSGLLVVAKDDATHIGLSQQMAVQSFAVMVSFLSVVCVTFSVFRDRPSTYSAGWWRRSGRRWPSTRPRSAREPAP